MFMDDRKGLICQPELTFWRCPSFGLKAAERENKIFPPKTNVSQSKKVSFGARTFFWKHSETRVWNWTLKTTSVGARFKPSKTDLFSTRLLACFWENVCFGNVCFVCANKLVDKTFVLGWNNYSSTTSLPIKLKGLFFHWHACTHFFFEQTCCLKNFSFETLVSRRQNSVSSRVGCWPPPPA